MGRWMYDGGGNSYGVRGTRSIGYKHQNWRGRSIGVVYNMAIVQDRYVEQIIPRALQRLLSEKVSSSPSLSHHLPIALLSHPSNLELLHPPLHHFPLLPLPPPHPHLLPGRRIHPPSNPPIPPIHQHAHRRALQIWNPALPQPPPLPRNLHKQVCRDVAIAGAAGEQGAGNEVVVGEEGGEGCLGVGEAMEEESNGRDGVGNGGGGERGEEG